MAVCFEEVSRHIGTLSAKASFCSFVSSHLEKRHLKNIVQRQHSVSDNSCFVFISYNIHNVTTISAFFFFLFFSDFILKSTKLPPSLRLDPCLPFRP